jgi:hypothetical protein
MHRALRIVALVAGLAFLCQVGRTDDIAEGNWHGGPYIYPSYFSMEYRNDAWTNLLFHFGEPQPFRLDPYAKEMEETLREKRKAVAIDEDDVYDDETRVGGELADLESAVKETEEGEFIRLDIEEFEEEPLPPIEEGPYPTDTLYDYSDFRNHLPLPEGAKGDPDGKFGGCVALDGTGPGIRVPSHVMVYPDSSLGRKEQKRRYVHVVECWVKIDAYPEEDACLLSTGDEARVILQPDGHLRLQRAKPWGTPNASHLNPGAHEWFMASTPDPMISEFKLPVGEWAHVAAGRGKVARGENHILELYINGHKVARYVSGGINVYKPFRYGPFVIGNNVSGDQPLRAKIDEVRASAGMIFNKIPRLFIRPQEPLVEDEDQDRPLQFGRPFFLQDKTLFHASLDDKFGFEFHKAGLESIRFERPLEDPSVLAFDGVRGSAVAVDPRVTLFSIPADGLRLEEGTIEYWVKPYNWSSGAGSVYKGSNPTLSIMKLVVYDKAEDRERALIHHRQSRSADPGFHMRHWHHFTVTWRISGEEGKHNKYWSLYRNGRRQGRGVRFLDNFLWTRTDDLELVRIEFGASDGRTVNPLLPPVEGYDGRPPVTVYDEIVAHDYAMLPPEVPQAHQRPLAELKPLKPYDIKTKYRIPIGELDVQATAYPSPAGVPHRLRVRLENAQTGRIMRGPIEAPFRDTVVERGKLVMKEPDEGDNEEEDGSASSGPEAAQRMAKSPMPGEGALPLETPMRFEFEILDADGEAFITDSKDWTIHKDKWRGNDIGVPETAPEPWHPVEVDGRTIKTLMTTYKLGEDGLPEAILSEGENLLASPVRLLENGKPMRHTGLSIQPSDDVEVRWTTTFEGETCEVEVQMSCEFDGCVRHELTITPKGGPVGALAWEIPVHKKYASHLIRARASGGRAIVDRFKQKRFSTLDEAYRRVRRRASRRRKMEAPDRETFRAYSFWTQVDLNNTRRGLWWFADRAAGWNQSDAIPAQVLEPRGDAVVMRHNLVAEPSAYEWDKPLVFGLIAHPARPLARYHRYYGRAPAPNDERAGRTFANTFMTVPTHPKRKTQFFPARKDKSQGEWEHAESCLEMMKMIYRGGYRTMYQTLGFISCNTGAYDNWAWRNADPVRASLNDSLVEYMCYYLDGFLKRDIYDAIYLDDTYNVPVNGANAIKAGMAIELPNGEMQPGHRNFHTRELLKRWYVIFQKNGKRPMIMPHHTGYWMYPAMVFCASTLDGEGKPTITGGNRDFIDKYPLARAEAILTPDLWGVPRTYMVSVWEHGPLHKGLNPHKPWSWRMARSAMAMIAHFECDTAFIDQGGDVYASYWNAVLKWGAGDAKTVEFVPYRDVAPYVDVEGLGEDTLVSFYRDTKQGRVLLIVSNLGSKEGEERKIRIRLKPDAMGLRKGFTSKALNPAFVRPEGIDPYLGEGGRPRPGDDEDPHLLGHENALIDDSLTSEITAKTFDQPPTVEELLRIKEPKLSGNELVVPVRHHDFRVISLE